MHREIQIKQFPIVTTHWWPKTRNERLCEKTNSIYIVFYLLYTSTTLQTRPPSSVDADAPCECSVSQSAREHTHVTHRITWTWLCTRCKKRYKYCSFSHTNRSFRVLGHQCVVTMGNCLIWISLCMFFFPSYRDSDLYLPLYDWQTRTVWPKNIKIGSTEEKKTPTSWMPLG